MRTLARPLALGALALAVACGSGGGQATPSTSPSPSPSPSASPSASPSPSPSPVATTSFVAAYFLRHEQVAPVQRTARGPGVAAAAVTALLQGPTSAERAAGLSTAVPAGTRLRSISIAHGVAVVDLTGAFGSGGGSASMTERLAQLVTTVTQFSSAPRVRLWLDGSPASTLGGEGLMVDRPLGRADVESALPAILIDNPAGGATISSPVRVRGSANVFEAVLFVQVRSSTGKVLATRRVMASSGTGTRGTFDVTLSFDPSGFSNGDLRGYSISAKDGSRINIVDTPVSFSR